MAANDCDIHLVNIELLVLSDESVGTHNIKSCHTKEMSWFVNSVLLQNFQRIEVNSKNTSKKMCDTQNNFTCPDATGKQHTGLTFSEDGYG